MGFTRDDLAKVEGEIANLAAVNFTVGGLSIDQEKTIRSLLALRVAIKAELNKGDGLAFGKAKIDGMD